MWKVWQVGAKCSSSGIILNCGKWCWWTARNSLLIVPPQKNHLHYYVIHWHCAATLAWPQRSSSCLSYIQMQPAASVITSLPVSNNWNVSTISKAQQKICCLLQVWKWVYLCTTIWGNKEPTGIPTTVGKSFMHVLLAWYLANLLASFFSFTLLC